MIDDSRVITHPSGDISFVGPDAVALYRALALHSALGLLSHGIAPGRGVTRTKALALASKYTGKSYKRTELERARTDLMVWIEAMKLAMPVERR